MRYRILSVDYQVIWVHVNHKQLELEKFRGSWVGCAPGNANANDLAWELGQSVRSSNKPVGNFTLIFNHHVFPWHNTEQNWTVFLSNAVFKGYYGHIYMCQGSIENYYHTKPKRPESNKLSNLINFKCFTNSI